MNRTPLELTAAELISGFDSLDLIARLVVEGFLTGLHRSPFHGFSVEFSQHRSYIPGDDLRYLDWKVLARTDRYSIKQYEEETNVRVYILLDISASMGYGKNISKLDYAKLLAASLAYFIIRQRDAVGLTLYNQEIQNSIKPSSAPSQLKIVFEILEQTRASARTKSSLVFHQLAEQLTRKSMIIILSDFMDEETELIDGLRHLRHYHHDIIAFQILTEDELNFPFQGEMEFIDLEENYTLKTLPTLLRKQYVSQMRNFQSRLMQSMLDQNIDFHILDTGRPVRNALFEYLLNRKRHF